MECEEILSKIQDVIVREFKDREFSKYERGLLEMLIVRVLFGKSFRGVIELAVTNEVVKVFLGVKEVPSRSS
ncbi:hypothetical protein HS7_12830 [Sulfolobales archaeon HS-7]|nr:hypothetical protein HS7_12830 [Sulfolobales archaeon HS-7]